MKNHTLIYLLLALSSVIYSCNVSKKLECPDYAKNTKLKQHAKYLKKIERAGEISVVATIESDANEPNVKAEGTLKAEINTTPSHFGQNNTSGDPSNSKYLTASTKNDSYFDISLEKRTEAEEIFNSLNKRQQKKLKKLQTKIERKSDTREIAHRASGDVNGLAIASLVTGVVGLLVFGFILGAAAIIFGAIALTKIKTTGQAGRGLALAGLILGIIDIVALLIILA